MLKRPLIHPILFVLFPVLYLYGKNIEFVTYRDTVLPVLINLGLMAVFLLISYLATKDWKKAGVEASIFLVLFSSLGHAFYFVAAQGYSTSVSQALVLLYVVLFILLSWINFRVIRNHVPVSEFLNVVSITLILFSGMNIIRGISTTEIELEIPPISTAQAPTTLPDIYYIILDGYGGSEMFSDLYDFDNSPFVSEMETRGFYVARGSFSNYIRTVQSLNSALNLQYLENDKNWATNLLYLNNNFVQEQLKYFGYTVYTGHNEFDTTNWTGSISIDAPPVGTSFFRQYLNSTAFFIVSNQITVDFHRELILNSFNSIESVTEKEGPKFVFLHLITPHPPFIFNRDGGETFTDVPFTFLDAAELGLPAKQYHTLYIEQLKFINTKLLESVDLILKNSETPPIIIIQGDHGPRSFADLENFGANHCFYESFSILNAYYFPNQDYEDLYNNITPVNSFRVVLNRYFGFSYEMLADQAFYTKYDDYDDSTEVTSLIKNKICNAAP